MTEAVKAPSKFDVLRKNFVKFFKEVRSELKKVIWPSRTQLTNNTLTVLLSCLIVGLIIWLVDMGLVKATERLFIK